MVDYYDSINSTDVSPKETAIPFIDDDLNSNREANDDNWSSIDDRDYCMITDDDGARQRLKEQESQQQQHQQHQVPQQSSLKHLSLNLIQDLIQSLLFYLQSFLTLLLSYFYLSIYRNIEAFSLTCFIFVLSVALRIFVAVLIKYPIFMLKDKFNSQKCFIKYFLKLPHVLITLYQLDIVYWLIKKYRYNGNRIKALKYDYYIKQILNTQIYFESIFQFITQIYLYKIIQRKPHVNLQISLILTTFLIILVGLIKQIHIKNSSNFIIKHQIKTLWFTLHILPRLVLLALFQAQYFIEIFLVFYLNFILTFTLNLIELKVLNLQQTYTNLLKLQNKSKIIYLSLFSHIKLTILFSLFGLCLYSIQNTNEKCKTKYVLLKILYFLFYYCENLVLIYVVHSNESNMLTVVAVCLTILLSIALNGYLVSQNIEIRIVDVNLNVPQPLNNTIANETATSVDQTVNTFLSEDCNDTVSFPDDRIKRLVRINLSNKKKHLLSDMSQNVSRIFYIISKKNLLFLDAIHKLIHVYDANLKRHKLIDLTLIDLKCITNVCLNDGKSEILISDCLQKKIFIFNYDYECTRCIDANTLITFDFVLVDSTNDIYLIDWKNSQLLTMNANGVLCNKIYIKFSEKCLKLKQVCLQNGYMYFLCENQAANMNCIYIAEKLYLNVVFKFEFQFGLYDFNGLCGILNGNYLLTSAKKKVFFNRSSVSDSTYLYLFDCVNFKLLNEILLDNNSDSIEDLFVLDNNKLFMCRTNECPFYIEI